ncbi:CoB--CoM heterodisulfide reductase iron-sulfur subunit B family protein [Syntrophomonas wolfei]|jgi:heterodisulfide reductase subunit B|uniref:CoB--CoM heterodisulfide reductase iron-sulfur subunit B family protein n=1 Tax=Syntrophomonas wolfei TaxID=863 RepID=UPI0023F529D1|nr:CoB--CoM heterodisulfide reductase iron-sulfur subunit B family protein [Syntrophomonas wolfei]
MKLAYYPGCSLDGSAIEYGLSTKRTAELLGVELLEIEDWNCCGATSGHNTNKLLSLALPARNLALAEKTGLDVLAPCAACYNRFRNTEHVVRHDRKMQEKITAVIEMDYAASNQTLSILELIVNKVGLEKLREKVSQPLKAMKAACYYGCLLVRPQEHTGFDDNEDPRSMDLIMQALGAESVEWSFKTECCGAALATSRPDVGYRMIYEVIRNAREAGAECLVTACPLCMMNLDMRRRGVEKAFNQRLDIPVYYITELLAIACGDSPRDVGVHRHFVEAESYLASLPEKAARIEAEEAARLEAEQAKKAARAAQAKKAAQDKAKKKEASEAEAMAKAGDEKKAAPAAEAAAKAETKEKAAPAVEAAATLAEVGDKGSKAAQTQAQAAVPAIAEADDDGALQKKINAMIKAWEKSPEKVAARLIEDEERAAILAQVVSGDEKKTARLAELMITDKDKAAKAAEAFVTGELKKRQKAQES